MAEERKILPLAKRYHYGGLASIVDGISVLGYYEGMIKRCVQAAVVGVLLAASFFIPMPKTPLVSTAGVGTIAFGGRILYATVCTCSVGSLGILVGPPRGGLFIFQPGVSILSAFYNIFRPGPWVLGTATGVAPCMQVRGPSCVPDTVVPAGLVILRGGTSF